MAEKDVTVSLDEAGVDFRLVPQLRADLPELARAEATYLVGDRRGRRGTWPRI